MKKISLLLVLIMCVTIGGVYAAWIYSESTAGTVDQTITHGMETATGESAVGILEIIHNDAAVLIDQGENYHAKLVTKGSITVRFTPNPGAADEVYTDAIPAVATIYTQNTELNLYDGHEIYVTPENAEVELVWQKVEGENYFEAVLNANDIDELIDLGYDFVLDQYDEYLAFQTLEGKITLSILISQKAN